MCISKKKLETRGGGQSCQVDRRGVGKIALLVNFLDLSGINVFSMTHDDSGD